MSGESVAFQHMIDVPEEYAKLTDESLILACRRGDELAWTQLIIRYKRLIYTVPRRAGLSREQADDVFQHVFATLLEKLPQIERPDRISAWLVTTARREAWRVIRRDSDSQVSVDDNGEHFDTPDESSHLDEMFLRLEEQHVVRSSLAALEPRCRTLLTMLYYQPDPVPYSEIAIALGISEGSIGPIRARCLQKLLRLLRKAGL